MAATVLRYAAFTSDPAGGNPAGVVLDASDLTDAEMLQVAADVGYSETAFLTRRDEPDHFTVRYFSPRAEVDFCGHATIAAAVALNDREARESLVLHTNQGEVPVDLTQDDSGAAIARLTSVPASSRPATHDQVARTLASLRWDLSDLGDLPPAVAYAGNHHLILNAAERDRLARLDYDFDALAALMDAEGWTTVMLVHVDREGVVHARNPFPPGGVVEDPATGAAAAAFGGHLRALGLVGRETELLVRQGDDMGRPSLLRVTVSPDDPRVGVAGAAVPIVGAASSGAS